jgi:hypothetical protein
VTWFNGELGPKRLAVLHDLVPNAATPSEIDTAFATIVQDRIGALVVAADAFLQNRREQIVALAVR